MIAVVMMGAAPTSCGLAPGAASKRDRPLTGALSLIVAPDDGAATIVSAIATARRRVLIEVYMLTSPDVLVALRAAHDAGCDVRVLLEAAPYGAPNANGPAFMALAAQGIDVRWLARPRGLVHTKVAIVDDAVFLMTMNLTVAGLGLNREYAIVDRTAADVGWAQAVWNADATGADPGPPPAVTPLLTSPIDARTRLTAVVDAARASIAVEIEEISDVELVNHLIAARERGIAVTVVAPASDRSAATTTALGRLVDGGAVVRTLSSPTVHAKAMVVDGRQAYLGSVNFTRASLDDNREWGILIAEPDIVARVATTITGDAARGMDL